jgi:molybdopterin/thiamine biosynthesis adenylyltransferase
MHASPVRDCAARALHNFITRRKANVMNDTRYTIAPWVNVDPFFGNARLVRFWTGRHMTESRDVTLTDGGHTILTLLESGATAQHIAREVRLPEAQVRELIDGLTAEGIVCELAEFPVDLDRYSRHMLFYGLLGTDPVRAQRRLGSLQMVVLGLGGIGTHVALELVSIGVGSVRIVDGDVVEESNLPRQMLYHEADIGRSKAVAARERLLAYRTSASVEGVHGTPDTVRGIRDLIRGADFLFLAAERPANIADIVDEACFMEHVPYCAIGYYNARLVAGPLRMPSQTGCLRCGESRVNVRQGTFQHGYVAPSFGPLNSLISSFGVSEVVKYLLLGDCAIRNVQMEFDGVTGSQRFIQFEKDPRCERCSISARAARTI